MKIIAKHTYGDYQTLYNCATVSHHIVTKYNTPELWTLTPSHWSAFRSITV